ncbi:MAG: hypothetical protein K1X79_06975 [Oligoflexia bacterium]|nr:hypothetical protein [Oligoflexia bacterium]
MPIERAKLISEISHLLQRIITCNSLSEADKLAVIKEVHELLVVDQQKEAE